MKFRIEQLAISPADPVKAKELLIAMGFETWVEDHVKAQGEVGYSFNCMNEADLSFNYEAFAGKEFEVLNYTDGPNWLTSAKCMQNRSGSSDLSLASHIGMHCTHAELQEWRDFFAARDIRIAQEVFTRSHTNEAIKDTRRYNYVIFDTRAILGIDVKFIVRWNTVAMEVMK